MHLQKGDYSKPSVILDLHPIKCYHYTGKGHCSYKIGVEVYVASVTTLYFKACVKTGLTFLDGFWKKESLKNGKVSKIQAYCIA